MSIPPGALDVCAISIGAIGGAISRYQLGKIASEYISRDPKKHGHWIGWHTAGINVAGSFILGMVVGAPSPNMLTGSGKELGTASTKVTSFLPSSAIGLTSRQKLMLGVGFCGSFTTFSTYSVDLVKMASEGHALRAFLYGSANNVGGFAAAALGMLFVRKVSGR